jgi:uncharacterized protein YcbK (DUF882 family)
MILAPYFTIEELLVSRDHPELAASVHDAPPEVLLNLARLAWSVLVPLRQRFGRIVITSGYRPRALNAKVNGGDSSRHLSGCAADFVLKHPAKKAWEEVLNSGVPWNWDRLTYYEERGRFHADIDPVSDQQRGLLYLGDGGWRQV